MADSKILEVDRDEWFYQSMTKYSNLYMFEMEFPLDSLEIINETSLCISGVQNYSKKCEILQLCVPPKLLRSEDEEGLCKDRDFKILSGGYADGRIKQIKSVPKQPSLVATIQTEYNGVVLYEVGGDNRATILEKCRFSTGSLQHTPNAKSLCNMTDRTILGTTSGDLPGHGSSILLHEWKTDDSYSTCNSPTKTYPIWKGSDTLGQEHIVKIKQWDENTCIFLTNRGTIALYDFRTGADSPGLFFHASKSAHNKPAQATTSSVSDTTSVILFSFDCIPQLSKVGILDSCGGYETFDPRHVHPSSSTTRDDDNTTTPSSAMARSLLPDFAHLGGVYSESFNIEYEPWTRVRETVSSSRFIISGLRQECVSVYEEEVENTDLQLKTSGGGDGGSGTGDLVRPVFSHDGHSKPVSHSIWHPVANNLVFSASVDAVLHAWQFIPDEEK